MRSWLLGILVVIGGVSVAAQDTTGTLPPYGSVVGNLGPGGSESWTFDAVDGEVISLVAKATDDVDPMLAVFTETGALLVAQDDYDYPNTRDAAVQSLTIPFTGSYRVQVSAHGLTSGSYRLTRLRGYGEQLAVNAFTEGTAWASPNENLDVNLAADALTLSLAGLGVAGLATDEGATRLEDYYVQVDVNVTNNRGGWVVHVAHHQQRDDRYYQFSINDSGLWRYALRDGETLTPLRDWVSHPAIVPGQTTFSPGIMVNGNGFDLFYNGSLLGHIVDDTLDGGVLGLGLQTAEAINAEATVTFENLLVTVPIETNAGTDPLPGQIIIANAPRMAQSLERRRVIPVGGRLALNVPESSTQSVELGVSRLPLGRGTTYTNFVLSTEITITANAVGESGCGLFMRGTTDTDYILAYIDQTGAYALAERNDNVFLPGVFGERSGLSDGEHHLLVTTVDEQLRYYIDGLFVGGIEAEVVAGNIGNAVVNYQPNTTSCNFQNTWLWTWDPIEGG